jgi:hypothetical protein
MEHERGAFKVNRQRMHGAVKNGPVGLLAADRHAIKRCNAKKRGAGNLDTRLRLLKKYTVCQGRIHFFRPKIRQWRRLSAAKSEIIQRSHSVTVFQHRGMLLAIPLTQTAVGPFRSV